MSQLCAGLDVGVETTHICVIDEQGEVLQETSCSTSLAAVHRQIAWLRRRRHVTVAMEAGCGTQLARGLRSRGYCVELYETRKLSKFLKIRRNKTDAGDAIGIAQAARLGATLVSKVHLKDLECQALQSRLIIRQQLIRQRVATINLLCRQIELLGGRISKAARSGQLRRQVQEQLSSLFGRTHSQLRSDLGTLLDHAERLIVQQTDLDQELKKLAFQNEVCRRFMDIPGVGPICALTFYALIGDPTRFERARDVGPYLGLTPVLKQSGLTRRVGRISKMGSQAARTRLVTSSVQFMRVSNSDSALKRWALDLEARCGRKKSRVALARKLAIVMIAMWKKGESYRSSIPALQKSSPGRASE